MKMMIMINKEGLVRIFVCLRRLGARGGFWDDIIEPANYLGIILDVMGSGMPCDVLSIIGLVIPKYKQSKKSKKRLVTNLHTEI